MSVLVFTRTWVSPLHTHGQQGPRGRSVSLWNVLTPSPLLNYLLQVHHFTVDSYCHPTLCVIQMCTGAVLLLFIHIIFIKWHSSVLTVICNTRLIVHQTKFCSCTLKMIIHVFPQCQLYKSKGHNVLQWYFICSVLSTLILTSAGQLFWPLPSTFKPSQ